MLHVPSAQSTMRFIWRRTLPPTRVAVNLSGSDQSADPRSCGRVGRHAQCQSASNGSLNASVTVMRRLISVVLVGALLACGGGDKTTGPGEPLSGSFTLRTLNSSTLPAILVQDATGQVEVLSGNLNFNNDRTWN